jgi:hypothetical protein
MQHLNAADESWEILQQFLPENLEASAREQGAFRRARGEIHSAEVLLRLLLLHVAGGLSLGRQQPRAELLGGRHQRRRTGVRLKSPVRYVVNLVMWCRGRTNLDLLGFWHPQQHIIFCTQTIQRTPIGPFWFALPMARREFTRE